MPTGFYRRTEEHKRKISDSLIGMCSGSRHWNWKGGVTPDTKRIKNSLEFKRWKKLVLERGNYICSLCGSRDNLTTDHIKSWSEYPKLRFDVNNGRVLCFSCHRKMDNYGAHKMTEEQKKHLSDYNRENPNSGVFRNGHKGYKSFLGRALSEEHRRKISEANKRYWARVKK